MAEKKAIATLIYYPEQKMEQVFKTEEKLEAYRAGTIVENI